MDKVPERSLDGARKRSKLNVLRYAKKKVTAKENDQSKSHSHEDLLETPKKKDKKLSIIDRFKKFSPSKKSTGSKSDNFLSSSDTDLTSTNYEQELKEMSDVESEKKNENIVSTLQQASSSLFARIAWRSTEEEVKNDSKTEDKRQEKQDKPKNSGDKQEETQDNQEKPQIKEKKRVKIEDPLNKLEDKASKTEDPVLKTVNKRSKPEDLRIKPEPTAPKPEYGRISPQNDRNKPEFSGITPDYDRNKPEHSRNTPEPERNTPEDTRERSEESEIFQETQESCGEDNNQSENDNSEALSIDKRRLSSPGRLREDKHVENADKVTSEMPAFSDLIMDTTQDTSTVMNF